MISAKPIAMVAMLALAGVAVARQKADEQRIAEGGWGLTPRGGRCSRASP